ncbi:MAG: TIGR03621 family F420-dependent LLM class oxidoreductase [Chloroflexi bacterium]|nr:TIGR03621 family F420-dependent LLM class oxidoreductase [Chloroflexota bacterium]
MHPFRFGVVLESVRDEHSLRETVRRAESAGFATVLIRDHFAAEPFGPKLAPLTALATVAAHSTSLRLGTLVIDNDFRHPAVLAKEIATLDLFSGGRVELGLGAGWLAAEYRQTGIPFDSPGTRIARLEESVAILKGLLSGKPVTFHGEHYQVTDLQNFPEPVQAPHPPFLLGGGAKRMLSLAGREADIISVLSTSVASGVQIDSIAGRSSAHLAQKVSWIRDAAGDRFASIELSLFPDILVTNDHIAGARQFAAARGWNVSPETVLDMPAVLIGTVDRIAENLLAQRQNLGFSYFVVSDTDLEMAAPIVCQLAGT